MNTAVGHQLRVLLLEDNPGDVRLVREYFKEARGSVLLIDHEETLAQARDLLGLDAYDAAQIDLSVDDSEGIGTFRALRAVNPGLPWWC